MKNKTEKDFVKWISETIEYYRPHIDIGIQKVYIEKKDCEYLSITFSYPYLEPVLYFSNKAFEDWKVDKLYKSRILHELVHILTDPLYAKACSRHVGKTDLEDERERLTDRLSVILNNLIKFELCWMLIFLMFYEGALFLNLNQL